MAGSNDWVLDDQIVPMHHHSGDERKDFLMDFGAATPTPVSVDEANRIARDRCGIQECEESKALSRRSALAGGLGAGLGALALPSVAPRMAFAADATGHIVVCIFLRGGFDGLSAVVPYGDPDLYKLRPTIGVRSSQGMWDLDGFFGAHPQMAPLGAMWQGKDLAFVHATGNPDPTRSHFDAQVSTERAAGWDSKATSVSTGWLGRHLASSSSQAGTFRALTLGSRAVLAVSSSRPTLSFSSIADFDLWGWAGYKPSNFNALRRMYERVGGEAHRQAATTLDAIDGLAGLRAQSAGYTPPNGAKYPSTYFGKSMMQIAMMIRAGKGLEVACADVGDWDMHANLGKASDPNAWFSRRIRELSDTLAAFRTDLGPLWDKVTVVTMSEFGRRAGENASAGVDHGHGNLIMVAGGKVAGGKVYGKWPTLAHSTLDHGDLAIATDYRTILAELMVNRLGNTNLSTVLPNYSPVPHLGIFPKV